MGFLTSLLTDELSGSWGEHIVMLLHGSVF